MVSWWCIFCWIPQIKGKKVFLFAWTVSIWCMDICFRSFYFLVDLGNNSDHWVLKRLPHQYLCTSECCEYFMLYAVCTQEDKNRIIIINMTKVHRETYCNHCAYYYGSYATEIKYKKRLNYTDNSIGYWKQKCSSQVLSVWNHCEK